MKAQSVIRMNHAELNLNVLVPGEAQGMACAAQRVLVNPDGPPLPV